ncbi:MAG: four helix bundle protein [Desulfitobacteriaceae bacterium]
MVWQKAHLLVLSVYRISRAFSKYEIYGLSSQFRRAAVSIVANIAEGFRKRSKADKFRFLNIAQGSVEECRYYLILTNDLGYADISETNFFCKRLVNYWKHILVAF